MNFNITGTGMYVPENIVTNNDLSLIVDTSDEWIVQRVGVKERHICTNETAADLAYHAAKAALDDCNCPPEDIDLILAATVSGETVSPSIACMVQKMLGISCMAFDINAACSSFIFLLETAAGFFARGVAEKVLVIGAERMSRIVDWTDRSTCVIMGDGAGAAVLSKGGGYISSVINVKGDDSVIKIPQFIGNSPFFKPTQEKPYIHMNGQETFKYAVNSICNDIEEVLKKSDITLEDIKYIVPHQANIRIIEFASRKLNVPLDKFYVNIDRYGNTSAASIPIALDEMNKKGMLNKDDLIVLSAFGGGLSSASCIINW